MKNRNMNQPIQTIGIDLGDQTNQLCALDADGRIAYEMQFPNTLHSLQEIFTDLEPVLVVMEASTHSPWASFALEELGHEVLVANPRRLRAISDSQNKNDRNDARLLARLGRADRALLSPIRHRGAETQADLSLLKTRHALVRVRTLLINQCRGLVKSMGWRLAPSSAESFHKLAETVPASLRAALDPLMDSIAETSDRIRQLERQIEKLAREKYPAVAQLTQVIGVGPLTAMCFILIIEDPQRFAKSRQVGAYIGLAPACDQSGQSNKQMHITRAGNPYLRLLLVQCAQYVLSRRSKPSELKEWGLKLAERGGKAAKKRAVIAVARRLAVLLHRLWVSGKPYDPFYARSRREAAAQEEAGGIGSRQSAQVLGRVKDKPPAAVQLAPHP